MTRHYPKGSIAWDPLGLIQLHIKENIRKEQREGLLPTFEEFAIFVSQDLTNLTKAVNNHWKPIYFNCAPCIEK